MIPEPYLGLVVGSILTLIVSAVSVILANHYSERQWVKQRKLDEDKRAIEEVYSPLYLILFDMNYELGFIGGFFDSLLETGISKKQIQTGFIEWAQDYRKKEKPSQLIKSILRNKLGLIRPKDFRDEIFNLCLSLESFERRLAEIDTRTFENQEPSILEKRFKNYVKATAYYFHVSSHIRSFLDYLISNEPKVPSDHKYTKVLDITLEKKLGELLKGQYEEEANALAEKLLEDALKEISSLDQEEKKKIV